MKRVKVSATPITVHVICDNLSAHKAPVVHKWLLAHPRFELHFTPTYSSWINQVERWFAELERRCLERGVFCSLDELKTALEDWIKTWNEDARPFKWAKTADQIIDRICRYCGSPDQDTSSAAPVRRSRRSLQSPPHRSQSLGRAPAPQPGRSGSSDKVLSF
ncbi:transposase [Streptomyces capitiformicae]|uniref:transposase n=1 Tax=Streptomyces capitiformicae TaxID=2014920 RepID=UPI001E305C81|nr:transposase [Streptomyces capitiformicae]